MHSNLSFIREYPKTSKKNDQNEKNAESINENRNRTTANEDEVNDFIFYIRFKTNF